MPGAHGVPVVMAQPVAPPPQPARQPAATDAKKYRVFAKTIWYTQAALEAGELTNAQVLQAFGTIQIGVNTYRLIEYSIGNELHSEPANPLRSHHKHAYLKYDRKLSIRDARYCELFDLRGRNGRVLHPQIESVGNTTRDKAQVVAYSQKDGDYIASPALMHADPDRYEEDWPEQLNAATSVWEGLNALMTNFPAVYYRDGPRITQMLEKRIGVSDATEFSLDDFTVPRIGAAEMKKLAFVVHGEPGIGKTKFALSHFEHPLLISTIDDLKLISMRTDGLVFDDAVFNNPHSRGLSPEEMTHLLDVEHNRSISARYNDARIPKGMPRIFTTNSRMNDWDHIFPKGRNTAQQGGIDRRYKIHIGWLSGDIRRNPAQRQRVIGGP